MPESESCMVVLIRAARLEASASTAIIRSGFTLFATPNTISIVSTPVTPNTPGAIAHTLGISKSIGDLVGPTVFSVLMGISRAIYGKFGEKINLYKMMVFSGCLCVLSYLTVSFSSSAIVGLIGIAVSGFSVGILWPGTYSDASTSIKGGGTAMFAFLALAEMSVVQAVLHLQVK